MKKTKMTEVVLLTKSYNLQDFKDWLHWHLDIIGFDCCHVFDNESSVDIKTVCDSYGDRVTYELVKGWVRQYDLYNRYVNTQARAYWVLPIDDDEFLYMKNFTNVNEMLMYYQDKWKDMNKLSIRWKNMFPDDPKADRGDKSLQEFCKNENEEWAKLFAAGNTVIKTFVKTSGPIVYDERSNQTHNPIAGNRASYLCNGERLVGNWYRGPATDDDVKLYHYQYKSAKEWDWKCKNRLAVYGNRPFIYTYGQESIIERMK
ncbi:MAG: glycosyltransferase family 2 protein [Clostridia bacterium]|nr:glycosyltransferase family 2 protein [Clostridia bacterium]